MLMVVARVFHVLLFEGISSASLLVPQSVHPTLMILLSTALSLKACDGHLGLDELEVPLAISLSGDVCGLGATWYMLLMDRKLPSIVMVSKRALCVLK
ncbi:hypothetical protein TIFTF001_004128 [Ficus carica]|uniref:Uncharacterized protein n=1 Tax=Ficus carica TaxID=3494 RepID=A0AA87ZJU7_FICCA|nr:hypothetical protein TIFTF001_004128 [Ficus carica]